MKVMLRIAAAAEALTGLALLAVPVLVIKLLFGTPIDAIAIVLSRFAGISLVALGIACWPSGGRRMGLLAMLAYGAAATIYLGSLWLKGSFVGPLLVPAVAVHVLLTITLGIYWWKMGRQGNP